MTGRPNFYFGWLSVGHFLDAYPTAPGRYQYEPYRGEGHARFAEALRQGHAVVCSYTRGWKTVRLVVTAEEFVHRVPDCEWFVQISRLHVRPRALVMVLAWLVIAAAILGLRAFAGE